MFRFRFSLQKKENECNELIYNIATKNMGLEWVDPGFWFTGGK